ncbi:hypothetical protein CK203_053051 [Vitis vinifera]|uniref:DUF4283 domain-containing protein n=1 Tax=Vitis vinifera TaxID=29760 RepID=A0A438FL01_VITVI|nr:hypothetical protein CK203_053051 [Vitis vinifera]
MSDEMVRSLGPGRFLDWKVLNAKGTAGGVIICWDKRSLEILGWKRASFPFPVDSGMRVDGAIWVFTGVYGPFSREDREGLWEELGAIKRIVGGAVIIDELGLVDIPLQGGSFTWSGGLNNQTQARLDRFLATPCCRRVPRADKGVVARIEVSGRPSYRLATKLKGLKQNLKTWNKEVFGRLEKNKADALQQVESWDSVEEVRSLTEVELNQKKEAKESYEKWVSMEEVHWRQLSRELWLRGRG